MGGMCSSEEEPPLLEKLKEMKHHTTIANEDDLAEFKELLNEATRGTGCQHDAEMTWCALCQWLQRCTIDPATIVCVLTIRYL